MQDPWMTSGVEKLEILHEPWINLTDGSLHECRYGLCVDDSNILQGVALASPETGPRFPLAMSPALRGKIQGSQGGDDLSPPINTSPKDHQEYIKGVSDAHRPASPAT